jgi:hypothetical protein
VASSEAVQAHVRPVVAAAVDARRPEAALAAAEVAAAVLAAVAAALAVAAAAEKAAVPVVESAARCSVAAEDRRADRPVQRVRDAPPAAGVQYWQAPWCLPVVPESSAVAARRRRVPAERLASDAE